jgi:hypothetical protein
MPLTQLEPEKYYFTVDCVKCKGQVPFAEAPSPDEDPSPKQRTISDLQCPRCGYNGTYAPALMYVAQGPETK